MAARRRKKKKEKIGLWYGAGMKYLDTAGAKASASARSRWKGECGWRGDEGAVEVEVVVMLMFVVVSCKGSWRRVGVGDSGSRSLLLRIGVMEGGFV